GRSLVRFRPRALLLGRWIHERICRPNFASQHYVASRQLVNSILVAVLIIIPHTPQFVPRFLPCCPATAPRLSHKLILQVYYYPPKPLILNNRETAISTLLTWAE